MNPIRKLHNDAMRLYDQYFQAQDMGRMDIAGSLLREAFEMERDAAALTEPNFDLEPTRSVLHRSAATLALNCGDVEEAKRLAQIGLSGRPPREILHELRDVLADAWSATA